MPPTPIVIVVFGTLLVPNFGEAASPPVLFAEYPVVTTCGGILTDNYSAIAYKSSINVNPNERCVWSIRTPNASCYTLEALYIGLKLEPGQTEITATCENLSGTNITNLSSTGVVQLPTTCQSLVITFFSGVNVSFSGFTLLYKASNFISATNKNAESSVRPIVLYSEYPVVSTCGGVLNSSNATIAYKTGINVAANERCVWTVSTPNAIDFKLNVVSLGLQLLQTGQTGITISCVSRNWSNRILNFAVKVAGKIGLSDCHKLLITFYAGGSVSSRGFILSYEARVYVNHISSISQDYIFSDSQQHIRHPTNAGASYANNEVSTFVFGTTNNLYSTYRKTLLIYVTDGLEGSGCNDMLQHYRFRPASGWMFSQQVCGGMDMVQWNDNDLMLITFKSDAAVVNRGFHISRTTITT